VAGPPATELDQLTALVTRMAFVAKTPGRLSPALVPRLAFVPKLARRLIRERRARCSQGEQAGEKECSNLAPHRRTSFLPPMNEQNYVQLPLPIPQRTI
jgi:hypothetical protein